MREKTTQEYLRILYELSGQGTVHAVDVARELGLSRPTVSVALRELAQDGYVQLNGRRLLLTEQGRTIAEEISARNRFFRELLEKLGMSSQAAQRDAAALASAISAEGYQAFQKAMAEKTGE